MKKLLFLICILGASSLFSKPLDETHKVVVLKDWKPYYSIDRTGKPSGYAVELFEKIALNIGLKYEYVIVDSWKEANRLMEEGKVDLIPNMGKALNRNEYSNFTQTTDTFEIQLFKHKSLKDVNSLKDIKNKSVGVVLKNVCTKLINEDITGTKVFFNNFNSSIAALENNEIDILCYPRTLVNQLVDELDLKNIVEFGKPLKAISRAISVTKNELHLLNFLDQELLKMKANGEYQKIYNKWFISHKDIEVDYEELILTLVIILLIIFIIMYYVIQSKFIVTKNELDKSINNIKELQEKQLEQQKMILTQSKVAAVGEMLRNIAHQWRQPLSIITTRVSGIQADIDFGHEITNDALQECANDIIYQSEYLSKTIEDFRNFFTANSEKIAEHKINDIFLNLKKLVESSFQNNFIEYIYTIEDDITIKINDNILIQALMNICNNAKDVFAQSVEHIEQRYFFVDVKKVDNNIVMIFKDSGGGIAEDIIDKIFEPYFTTKHQSLGTGIGLYMTNQIITKKLNGTINVINDAFMYNNQELKGAKFTITIPLEQKELNLSI